MKQLMISLTLAAITAGGAWAKVDLVTLPTRGEVQLTIYNSADLTLARDSRDLTLREGDNTLQFSWANTLIDPTSLDMLPLKHAGDIDIADLTFPPRMRELGVWHINSGVSGPVPMEITYFTSGLSWRAFYMGTLSEDEKTMHLQGYVRVQNNSGEDYENAQTRLIVGKVHLLDQIADLARREQPYGKPGPEPRPAPVPRFVGQPKRPALGNVPQAEALFSRARAPKKIVKEGLSEYFLYSIEGTETIRNGWAKRLPSFAADEVPVVNLYKYEEEMYGRSVVRFLSFANDEKHKLGETPIPGGMLKVYRGVGEAGHLSYEGQSSFKYIPVEEEVELNLGAVANMIVEPKLMNVVTENIVFNNHRNIIGWDDIATFKIEVKNTRDLPVKVEIKRNFGTPYWSLKKSGEHGRYEKVDADTVKFTLELPARSGRTFEYTLTKYQGTRQDEANR